MIPSGFAGGPWLVAPPWVEIGFSDLAWTVDGDASGWHVLRLGLLPDTGTVELGAVLDPADLEHEPEIEDRLAVPLSAAGWRALLDRLPWWVELDAEPLGFVDHRIYLPARRRFSAYNSCNDFVADLLKTAGIPIAARPWRTCRSLMRQVEAGLERQARWRAENGASGTITE